MSPKPDNNAFAICGAILFAALGAMLMATGSKDIQNIAAVALLAGAMSQWFAQVSELWLLSRIAAYIGIIHAFFAVISYLAR